MITTEDAEEHKFHQILDLPYFQEEQFQMWNRKIIECLYQKETAKKFVMKFVILSKLLVATGQRHLFNSMISGGGEVSSFNFLYTT